MEPTNESSATTPVMEDIPGHLQELVNLLVEDSARGLRDGDQWQTLQSIRIAARLLTIIRALQDD